MYTCIGSITSNTEDVSMDHNDNNIVPLISMSILWGSIISFVTSTSAIIITIIGMRFRQPIPLPPHISYVFSWYAPWTCLVSDRVVETPKHVTSFLDVRFHEVAAGAV